MIRIRPLLLLLILVSLSACRVQNVRIKQTGTAVVLQNGKASFSFDLSSGTYSIRNLADRTEVVSHAKMGINEWTSDDPGFRRSWDQHDVSDHFGSGTALDLRLEKDSGIVLHFTFILYEDQDFISAGGGITNSTDQSLQVKSIHVMEEGQLYEGLDKTPDFAMVDGFSGGEPLEYGRRFYSPLTRRNALKSRNNILLTFTGEGKRRSLVMGGLTYHDFEKFAAIEQPRRVELERGADGISSLVCYLDLPAGKADRGPGGEVLELVKGAGSRRWQYHEFHCTETATSVMEPGEVIVEARNIRTDGAYTLGISWWYGLWHGDHPDLYQSVFVEFERDGVTQKLPLLEYHPLPRFDGVKKKDAEQVELALPAQAVLAGKFRVIVEKSTSPAEAGPVQPSDEVADQNVYLSEIWLRDGTSEPFLPGTPTQVKDSPHPRRSYKARLYGMDPVGKRVDPGQTYMAPDLFYMNAAEPDPFLALEEYGMSVRTAQEIDLAMYDFPTVCLWYAENSYYGGSSAENTTQGAVEEMERIAESGFLKYSRAAVRLVPDSYMPDNQQGWWDDAHWRREDTDLNASKNGRYVEPYETSEKWGKAVTALGGIPLTYFQTSYRSEDYARQFPGHMLFNKRYAWKGEPVDTTDEIFTSWQNTWTRNGRVVWGYDYTDPDFLAHMTDVYANLKSGGIRGLMFDYPASGWASGGGMEDPYATTASAYRNIFRLASEGLGPEAFVHERNMERGTDISVGLVASMRTENDTDEMDGSTVTRCGLRWYKNRVLVNQDTDSKNIARLQGNRDRVRAVLTMAYVTTGRLLLANSFSQFTPETLYDLSRTFPYHTAPKSARPVDAFVSDFPAVYDFEVDPRWHQVTFYNPDPDSSKVVGIDLSGEQVDGALGLESDRSYYVFDFWNDGFIGKLDGDSRLEQQLRPGEARMMSVRECLDHPQVISTDRHVMQGYLDLENVGWDAGRLVLTGTSKVVDGDPYTVTIAPNGFRPGKASCQDTGTNTSLSAGTDGLVRLVLDRTENGTVTWSVFFSKEFSK